MSSAHAASRNQAVELLRIVSAFGIVAFHARAPLAEFGYAGLIVFLVLSPFMDVTRNWNKVRSPWHLARAFLVPWVFWAAAYGVLDLAVGKPLAAGGGIIGFALIGTSMHLWYLPFMFGALTVLNLVKQRVGADLLFVVCMVAGAVILATMPQWRERTFGWPPPFPQWTHASAAVLFGVALGLATKNALRATVLVPVLLITLAIVALNPMRGVTVPYILGVTALLGCLAGGNHLPKKMSVQSIADCMFGVYLVHIIFLFIAKRAIGSANLLAVAGAFGCSLAAVWVARRFVPASRLVLG